MNSRQFIRHDERVTPGRFRRNHGTHWKVAGAVAAIVFGGYAIYSNHDTSPITSAVVSSDAQAPVPTAHAPLNQDNKGVD